MLSISLGAVASGLGEVAVHQGLGKRGRGILAGDKDPVVKRAGQLVDRKVDIGVGGQLAALQCAEERCPVALALRRDDLGFEAAATAGTCCAWSARARKDRAGIGGGQGRGELAQVIAQVAAEVSVVGGAEELQGVGDEGALSVPVTHLLGARLPITAGKSYSVSVACPELPEAPMYLVESRAGATPLAGRLRLAGTIEFSGLNSRLDRRRITSLTRAARTARAYSPPSTGPTSPRNGPGCSRSSRTGCRFLTGCRAPPTPSSRPATPP